LRRGISTISRRISIWSFKPPIDAKLIESWSDGLSKTSFDPTNEIAVARNIQYTGGMLLGGDDFVAVFEMLRFSIWVAMDERSGFSGPVISLTMKLRRMPR
jgi:hypothetical protein